MNQQKIFEVIYIRSTLTAVWDALTNPELTVQYWFDTRIESDWKVGSPIRYLRNGTITDEHVVLAIDKPHSLTQTFKPLFVEFASEPASRAMLTLEENGGVVRLTVVHEDFAPDSKVFRACSDGWPMIFSNLKTLLETNATLPPFIFPPQTHRFE